MSPRHRSRKKKQQKARSFRGSDKFLMSYEWRAMRMFVIERDGRRCRCCGATPGDGMTRINVDHIKSRRDHPELALDPNNLQVLCSVCNHGKGNWSQTDWRPATPKIEAAPRPIEPDPVTYHPCWTPHVTAFTPRLRKKC